MQRKCRALLHPLAESKRIVAPVCKSGRGDVEINDSVTSLANAAILKESLHAFGYSFSVFLLTSFKMIIIIIFVYTSIWKSPCQAFLNFLALPFQTSVQGGI